jgi:hypothetical protein
VLKPPKEPLLPEPAEESVGELVQRVIEDGKTYAKAELGLARAQAADWLGALKLPAILLVLAVILALGSVVALAYGVAAGLATMIGPVAGGFVAFLIFGATAGCLAWLAASKIKELL